MPFVSYGQMKPPVALLGYQPDVPQNAVFLSVCRPLAGMAGFCAMLSGRMSPYAFFDLLLAHSLASKRKRKDDNEPVEADDEAIKQPGDPFDLLAEAAGYTDGESWWNMNIEQRRRQRHLRGRQGSCDRAQEALSNIPPAGTLSVKRVDASHDTSGPEGTFRHSRNLRGMACPGTGEYAEGEG